MFVAIEKYMSDVKAFQTKSNIVQLLSDLAAVAGADFQQAGTPAAAANGLMPGMKPTTPLSSGRPTADQRDLCGFNVLGTYNASALEKRLTELGTTTLDLQLQHLEKVAKAESSKKRKASAAAREPMQQLQVDKKQAIQRSVQHMVTAMTKFDTERCAKNWSLDPRWLPNYSLHVGPDTYCTLTTISQKQSKVRNRNSPFKGRGTAALHLPFAFLVPTDHPSVRACITWCWLFVLLFCCLFFCFFRENTNR